MFTLMLISTPLFRAGQCCWLVFCLTGLSLFMIVREIHFPQGFYTTLFTPSVSPDRLHETSRSPVHSGGISPSNLSCLIVGQFAPSG